MQATCVDIHKYHFTVIQRRQDQGSPSPSSFLPILLRTSSKRLFSNFPKQTTLRACGSPQSSECHQQVIAIFRISIPAPADVMAQSYPSPHSTRWIRNDESLPCLQRRLARWRRVRLQLQLQKHSSEPGHYKLHLRYIVGIY